MHRLMSIGLVAAAFLAGSLSSQEQAATPEAKKEATIRELLEVTGAGKLGKQVMDGMMTNMKPAFGPDFEEFWTEFSEEVRVEDLEDLIVPIYAKHLEQHELEALLEFNKSPVGVKVNAVLPTIMQESMAAGSQWGQEIAARAMTRYREREDR